MEKKVITINTDLRKFFRQYLEVTSPFHNISPRECDVLAEFMYFNYLYSEYPDKLRRKAVFDYDTRQQMRDQLGITSQMTFNNYIKHLRKKGAIKGQDISEEFIVKPSKDYALIYNFKIKDYDRQREE